MTSPLTTAQQVRLKINDIPVRTAVDMYADGTASAYQLPHNNIQSASAFVNSPAGWSATGATFDVTGFVTYDTLPYEGQQLRHVYVFNTFSDNEIGHFTAAGGDVNGAALEVVHTLMFDSVKRAAWAAPDGSEYDDTKSIAALKDLHSALKAEIMEDAVTSSDFNSWTLEQESYT